MATAVRPRNSGRIKVDQIAEKTASAEVTVEDKLKFTNAGDGVVETVDAAVAAAGTTQGTATALTKTVSVVTSATQGVADGVLVPDIAVGQAAEIINDTTSPVKVYPITGGRIGSSAATNDPHILHERQTGHFRRTATNQWYLV